MIFTKTCSWGMEFSFVEQNKTLVENKGVNKLIIILTPKLLEIFVKQPALAEFDGKDGKKFNFIVSAVIGFLE
jgi:hypothetical protein